MVKKEALFFSGGLLLCPLSAKFFPQIYLRWEKDHLGGKFFLFFNFCLSKNCWCGWRLLPQNAITTVHSSPALQQVENTPAKPLTAALPESWKTWKLVKKNSDLNKRLHLIMEIIYFSTDIQYLCNALKKMGFWSKSTICTITFLAHIFPLASLLHSEALRHP